MGSPLVKRIGDKPAFAGEELVVVPSPFFPHKLAKGYSDPFCQVVKTVNGIPIKNLAHLVEVLRDAKSEFITVEFDQRDGETLVFPRADMLAATDDILTDNGVRSQGSPDTLAIWNAKPARENDVTGGWLDLCVHRLDGLRTLIAYGSGQTFRRAATGTQTGRAHLRIALRRDVVGRGA